MADLTHAELFPKGVQEGKEVQVTKTVVQEAAKVRKRGLMAILGRLIHKKPKVPEGVVTRPTNEFTPMKPAKLDRLYPGGVPRAETEAAAPEVVEDKGGFAERWAIKMYQFFNEKKAAAREGAANPEGGRFKVSNEALAKGAEAVFGVGERAAKLLAGRQTG